MPQAVTTVFQRIGRVIAGFSLAQRTIAIIGVAVLALGIVALSSWLTRPTYTPLFSGMSASDANAVVEQLRSSSVPYELADGGATVLVPEKDVYDQRLAAASAGLPGTSSGGYSLLDDMGVTTSEFQQSVTYKRAIEGELAATISSIEGVTAASVQLAIPEESVFVSETVDATASVFVETSGNATLTSKQVEAIVHLTSAAVSGMKPENVAVVDQSGQTLSAAGVGTTGGVDQQASDYEARVTANVQQMLDTVVGPGNAKVTVVAEIDHSVNERVEETYTPAEGAPPLTEQTRTDRQDGSSSNAGVLGPDNIAVPSTGGDGTSESTETSRTNAVNKSTQSTSTPAGSLLRQSVSVAVDAGAGGDLSTAQLSDLVETAAGIDTERGDSIAVELVSFTQTSSEAAQAALQAAKESEAAERQAVLLNTLIIAAAIALPLLLAVIAALVRMRRRANSATEFDQLFGDRPAPPVRHRRGRGNGSDRPGGHDPARLPGDDPGPRARTRSRARAGQSRASPGRDRLPHPTGPEADGRAAAHPHRRPAERMSGLTDRQTAAVVLMNLDRAQAIEVMKHLSESEAEAVAAEIIGLQDLDAATTAQALGQFHRIASGHLPPARGGRDIAAGLLEASFGAERAAAVLGRVGSTAMNSSFDFLGSVDPAQLATLLDGELPQTVALVLAHLPTERAAAVLAALPDPTRTDVAHAIATMGTASQEAIAIVAEALKARTGTFASRDAPETLGGVEPLVEIIARSGATVEKALLASIEDRDSALAEDIRSRMFTFADIVKLDDRDTQRVLRGMDIRSLALALKGANQGIADLIRRNVSERNRENLDEEARTLGPVRMSQVEEARAEIVRTIRALEAAGDITVQRADEDEYVY